MKKSDMRKSLSSLILRWLGAGVAKYVGLDKTNSQHILEGIAYNLKRLPKLWAIKEDEKGLCMG